jgi:hypothetical protein
MLVSFVIVSSFTPGLFLKIGLAIIHGFILSMIVSYCVFGITGRKRNKCIINAVGGILLSVIAILDWRFEIYFMISCSLLITIVFLIIITCLEKGKASGDYASFSDKDFDNSWFDFIHEFIKDYPVFFPLDVAHYKRDRSAGCILEVGMGIRNKYQGIPVAKIKADSGYYLSPLDKLIPNPQMKCRGSVVIASRKRDFSCTVTLYWDEYTGHTEVKFIEKE